MSESRAKETVQVVLSTYLTREEFQLVWSYYFVAFQWNCLGAEEMPEEAAQEIWASVGKSMRWAIAMLGAEYGFPFKGIEVDEDGGWLPKQHEAIEPGNLYYVHRLRNGMWPYPSTSIRTAIKLIEQNKLSLDTEPFRVALKEVEADLREARKMMFEDDEQREELELTGKVIDYLMERKGYTRAAKVKVN